MRACVHACVRACMVRACASVCPSLNSTYLSSSVKVYISLMPPLFLHASGCVSACLRVCVPVCPCMCVGGLTIVSSVCPLHHTPLVWVDSITVVGTPSSSQCHTIVFGVDFGGVVLNEQRALLLKSEPGMVAEYELPASPAVDSFLCKKSGLLISSYRSTSSLRADFKIVLRFSVRLSTHSLEKRQSKCHYRLNVPSTLRKSCRLAIINAHT